MGVIFLIALPCCSQTSVPSVRWSTSGWRRGSISAWLRPWYFVEAGWYKEVGICIWGVGAAATVKAAPWVVKCA